MSAKKDQRKYTDEELADAYIFPVKLSAAEKEEADQALRVARGESRTQMSEDDSLQLRLFQLRFHMDDYMNGGQFDPKMNFGAVLAKYVKLLNKKQKEFAEEIGISEVELSQLINNHRRPADNILIRLEIHSNNAIPALAWYKLLVREKEHELSTDMVLREREVQYVSKKLTG